MAVPSMLISNIVDFDRAQEVLDPSTGLAAPTIITAAASKCAPVLAEVYVPANMVDTLLHNGAPIIPVTACATLQVL